MAMKRLLLVIVALAGTSQLRAGEVSFSLDVLPLLTKAGCNSGKCHGTPSGKGGFALSLRGFDADADYACLTRDFGGRRICLSVPQQSLLLLKATGSLPHGGG